jgi:predicted amidohydrolase
MALTRELNAATVVGIFEEATGRDGAHNTSLAIHRGRIAARYRKIHLPPNERTFEKSDRGAAVADLGFMRLGLSICYDNWFPESARMAFLAGAELLHMPFYWSSEWEVQDDIPRFRTGRNDTTILASRRNRMLKVFPSRALDNGMYLVMLDHANRARKLLQHLPGKSMVFDPYGELLAETKGWVEETICFDFNRQRVQEWRQSPFFPGRNLRSDIYCRAFRSMAQRRI